MNQFLTALANATAPGLVSIVLCSSIAGAAYLYQNFAQRLPASVRSHINELAATVVQSIEQKYVNNSMQVTGQLKKQEAMVTLLSLARGLGLPLDEVHASVAIEAAVYILNLYRQSKTTL